MGREVALSLNGEELVCELGSAIRREELYGKSRKLVLDDNDELLAAGYLTRDGRLLASDDYSMIYLDDAGSFSGKMRYEKGGEEVESRPSSFKETREMTPMEPSELQRFSVASVYPITPPAGLGAGLYQTEFNYTAAVEAHPAIVLVNASGPSFLLVGSWLDFAFLGKAVSYDLFDSEAEDDAEDSGDFGFDMF